MQNPVKCTRLLLKLSAEPMCLLSAIVYHITFKQVSVDTKQIAFLTFLKACYYC